MHEARDPSPHNGLLHTQVPLEQARNALSRLADAAHGGATFTLTKHGRPWARLTPVEAAPIHRRQAARWAVAGVDLDPYALFSAEHRLGVQQQIARQTAAHPWGREPAGLGEELQERRLLLDTHVLQWWWCCPGLLSPLLRCLLFDPETQPWISGISLLELSALARNTNNSSLETALARVQLDLDNEGLSLLTVQPQHLQRACRSPLNALDMHDAVLLAQAEQEGMVLLSADPALRSGTLTPIW